MLSEAVEQARLAAREAAKQARTVLGATNDPDLMLYNKMTPEKFEQIKAEYGPDALMDYIDTMERKRMGGKDA
jgi:hypothetical protein